MTVKEIPVNIRCVEFRQENTDPDYGSCVYARFYFNCDKYELTIISDCGNYSYKWIETPATEAFLHLIARMNSGYLVDKIYGQPHIFDYEATKNSLIKGYSDSDEDVQADLKEIFKELEADYEPDSAEEFVRRFVDLRLEVDRDVFDDEFLWNSIEYCYSADILKIKSIFETNIQPYIRKLIEK